MTIVTRGVLACALLCAACGGGADDETAEPTEVESDTAGDEMGDDPGLPDPAVTERETMSPEDCEAEGGQVVGDIGDGAIHRPDFVCPSGQPPIGDVPLGVEGSVCCPP